MTRGYIAALTVFVMSACAPSRPASMPQSVQHPLLGKRLPAFKRQALSGETVDTATTTGTVVVVKLFAKYCEPCKRTLPAAQKLHEDLPDVAFIGIAVDESRADAAAVAATYGLTFPVVHDEGNLLSGRFRVAELPMTFVVGRDGAIRWVGGSSEPESALPDAVRVLR